MKPPMLLLISLAMLLLGDTGGADDKPPTARLVHYSGQVQGVGFRLATVRIAHDYPVTGWVKNLKETEDEAHRLYNQQYFGMRYEDLLSTPFAEMSKFWKFLDVNRARDSSIGIKILSGRR